MILSTRTRSGAYERGVLRRAFVVLVLSHLVAGGVAAMMPIDDAWASELDGGERGLTGLIEYLIWVGVPVIVVTFAVWLVVAWYASTTLQMRLGWGVALLTGVVSPLVLTDLDMSWLWIAGPVTAHVLAAAATRLVVAQRP